MTPTWMSALPHADDRSATVCQCLPGYLIAPGRLDLAREVLLHLAGAADDGFIRERIDTGKPDVSATLWFSRAAYLYRVAANDTTAWPQQILPTLKRAAQAMISGGTACTRMDDGGLLSPADMPAGTPCPVGMNALWYNLLSLLADELRSAGDAVGDHFDRLAGRFRRSFSKAYWCSSHGCLCDPEAQKFPGHASAHDVPDPDQLLIATLPFSPLPRTKQRQIVLMVRDKGRGPSGAVLVPGISRESGLSGTDVPPGLTAPVYLAWLIEGNIRTADVPERAVDESAGWLAEMPPEPLARFYTGTTPADIPQNQNPHAPTCAEVRRARHLATRSATT